MTESEYVSRVEQRVELKATDVRRAKRVVVDTEKLFEKELKQIVLDSLHGKIDMDEQFKRQQKLLDLKTKIETFGSNIEEKASLDSKKLSLKEKKEMHHLANSDIYTQQEIADIFGTNQAQVSRYAKKPSSFFNEK